MIAGISHCHDYEPHPQHRWCGPDDDLYHCVGVPTEDEINAWYNRREAADEIERLEISKIEFPDTTIYARCWCAKCGFEIWPTGWYDSGGPVTLDMVVSVWQNDHDEESDCNATILWEEQP